MNDLLLLLVLVIAGVLGTSAVRHMRAGRSAARHHHRALDTLGTITAGRAQALQQELDDQRADKLPAQPAEDRPGGAAQAGAPTAAAGQHSPLANAAQGENGAYHVPPHVRVVSADAPLAPSGPQLVRSSRRFPPVPEASGPGDAVRLRPPTGQDRRDTAEMVAVDPANAAPKPIRRPTLTPPPALGKVSPPPAGPLGGGSPPAGGNGSTWSPARPAAASREGAGALTGGVDPSPTPPSPFPASQASPGVRVIDDAVLSSQPAVSAVPPPESVTGSPTERAGRSFRRPSRRVFSDGRAHRRVELPVPGERRRRTRIGAGVAGAVVVLALAGALVSQRGGGSSNSPGPSKVAVRPSPTAAAPSSPAATARPSTTTVPPSTTTGPLAPLSANAFAATYVVGSSPLTVSVSGRSWVEIRAGGPSGKVTFSGLMTAGQSQSVAAPAWIVIGNPAATVVTAAGRPVGLPNPASQQALTLTFQ